MDTIDAETTMQLLAEAGYNGIITSDITFVSLEPLYDARHPDAELLHGLYLEGKLKWNL